MYVEEQAILDATNGGLDIILYYYPQARKALETREKRFKIRDERTPSASLKQVEDGNWLVTDFGDDQVPRNAIRVCMKEEGKTFREAIVILAGRYGIGGIKSEVNKPELEIRDALPDESEGSYEFDVKTEISKEELAVLGPKVTSEVCKKYNVYSLNSFTYVKNRKATITKTTSTYPIFLFDHGEWKKLYQPLNPEKQYRFRYIGNKPKDFINGLAQLRKAYEDSRTAQLKRQEEDDKPKDIEKIEEAIICSGDRDSLNVAGFGYYPLWLNSETAVLSECQYKEIMACVKTLYILPDIDSTGIRASLRLGMKFLDIRFIWLPDSLATFKDNRGKPRKDLRDYVELYPSISDFKKLVNVAMPLQFWDMVTREEGIKYYLNDEHALFFLHANGFGKIEYKNTKGETIFVRVRDNMVKEVQAEEIKDFTLNFLKDRYLPIPLRNVVRKPNQLSEATLKGLPKLNIDFTDFDQFSQYLFFRNKTILVTGSEIRELRPGDSNRFAWEEKVIQRNFKILPDQFKITRNEDTGLYDIEIFNYDSKFFCYLINASRVHWQTELEGRLDCKDEEFKRKYIADHRFSIDGELLNEEEIQEQKEHLINKMFSIGYLLHQYKNKARPWAVYAIDNKISADGESHGRSGKSFCYSSLNLFKKSVTLPGRNPEITKNPHIYDRVTEYTDIVLVDDADQYLPFEFFYDTITGVMTVNPKNNKSYEIPFTKSPKFCFTSNFPLRNSDDSTEARVLYTVFSDYYHEKTERNNYRQTRKIADDFGKNLFDDYNDDEWNADLNFFAQCLRFYLSIPSPRKINPPMKNVTMRKMLSEMGAAFKDWAEVYFDVTGNNVNTQIVREEALDDFTKATKTQKWTTNKFTKALKAFCVYNNYVFNPKALQNSQGRIVRKDKDNVAKDMIYIQTKPIDPVELADKGSITEEEKPF